MIPLFYQQYKMLLALLLAFKMVEEPKALLYVAQVFWLLQKTFHHTNMQHTHPHHVVNGWALLQLSFYTKMS